MATEEFTFPTTTGPYLFSIDSPPLWHLSPAASPDVFLTKKPKQEVVVEEEEDSSLSMKLMGTDHEVDNKDERMDLLWEDFNEELLTRSESSRSSEDMVGMGCSKALKLSKTSVAMLSTRRSSSSSSSSSRSPPGMLVFVRILRKLFLIQNSSQRVS